MTPKPTQQESRVEYRVVGERKADGKLSQWASSRSPSKGWLAALGCYFQNVRLQRREVTKIRTPWEDVDDG